MILVDTSVWIDHLHKNDQALATALEQEQVLMHPFVIGELACGNLKNRGVVLSLLQKLPKTTVASEAEALGFIEQHKLMGRGIGYLDAHLLAAAALEAARLWTRDRRLANAARTLNLTFEEDW